VNKSTQKISIGIPISRNMPCTYFAVASALAQSSAVSEIVISDNCLNRDSKKVSRWLEDERVRYINTGQNVGAIGNFIRCWEEANERYFIWLGDDDFLHPSFGASLLKHIERSDGGIVAWSLLPSVHLSDRGTRPSGSIFPSIDGATAAERVRQVQSVNRWNFFFYSLFDRQNVSIHTLKYFMENWPSYTGDFDWAWTYSVAINGRIELVPEQLYFYNFDNWNSIGDANDREMTAFRNHLKPDSNKVDLKILMHVNCVLVSVLFILEHLLAQSKYTINYAFDYQSRNGATQSMADSLRSFWVCRFNGLLSPAESELHARLQDVLNCARGEVFLLELTDLLAARLSENSDIRSYVNSVILRSKEHEGVRRFIDRLNFQSSRTTSSCCRSVSNILVGKAIRFWQRLRGNCLMQPRDTEPIFLPSER
jgi:glycosyltransferase involved in cell wall biosynthesis